MNIAFNKFEDGLVPAIIQDAQTSKVLMLGYVNELSWSTTLETKKVTFFSRSKNRLWTKGEESGHFLELVSYAVDCDDDALLIKVNPVGPTCHTGSDTCWQEKNEASYGFLTTLENTIESRRNAADSEKSYVASLFDLGINKIAQKVGEEAVETVIEAMDSNDDLFLNESADLLFHYLILLQAKGFKLENVIEILMGRVKKS
ncbi:MAG: bifunctional phosphoribosyl-AMP cyclohydrolase/phosphoribosyl-ATP diphosphatase HisIE [Flavobacterium sp.]|nr:bifunctional phosphoribosyl-AMP cyclohydrolase/phosphoribosyl-ATP diphosphatase HisIE [Candidatus Neoflavobacterium equi]